MTSSIPALINPNIFKNVNDFINYAYSIFIKDFNPNSPQLEFNQKPIMGRSKNLDCSNCGNSCNNNFSCDKCPFINKLDIFQHICSDEDINLNILPEYKTKTNRTPGIYNRNRTAKVVWLRYIIENYKDENTIRYYSKRSPNGELNHYLWLFNEHYILILVEENKQNKIYIRTCYDIKSDRDEKMHFAQFMKYKKALKKSALSTL